MYDFLMGFLFTLGILALIEHYKNGKKRVNNRRK